MKLPFIIIADDDMQVLRAIQRDIRNEYRDDYRISATASANEALALIKELKLKNETVALIISDQRMPEMEGVEFLEKAKEIYPDAKLVLLTAYSDIEAAIKAINSVKLDFYLLKPWNPPHEKLYPALNDLLNEWQALYKPVIESIRIIGFQWSPKSHRLKEFLAGNLVPFLWMDIENHPDAEKYLASANSSPSDLPLVVLKDGSFMKDPLLPELAKGIGLQQTASGTMYDVLIIGGGPAGLAASVYGSCEGLKTLLIEKSFEIKAFTANQNSWHLFLQPPQKQHTELKDAVNSLLEILLEKKGRVVFTENGMLSDHQHIVLITRYHYF